MIEYLTYGYLKGPHISKGQQKKIARQSREYFIEEGKLKKILSNGEIKICIAGHEVNKYLQELHVMDSGEHLTTHVRDQHQKVMQLEMPRMQQPSRACKGEGNTNTSR